jgi:hypothetical protein
VGIKATDAVAAAVLTPSILGSATVDNMRIVSQSKSDVVRIAASSPWALTRGAGVPDAITEVMLQGESRLKGSTRLSRHILVKQAPDTSANYPVRILGGGSQALRTPGLTGAVGSKKLTIAFLTRLVTRATSVAVTALACERASDQAVIWWLRKRADGTWNFVPRDVNNGTIVDLSSAGRYAPDAYAWHLVWCTVDTTTGVQTAKYGINDVTLATATPAVADSLMAFDRLSALYGGDFATAAQPQFGGVDRKFFWMAQDTLDMTDVTVRDQFWNSATGAAVVSGAGTINGVTPIVFERGMAGDAMLGKNWGTGGDFLPVPYINQESVGFADLTS